MAIVTIEEIRSLVVMVLVLSPKLRQSLERWHDVEDLMQWDYHYL